MGVRKPDMVAIKGHIPHATEVQVEASSSNLEAAHYSKISKYRDDTDIISCLLSRRGHFGGAVE